MIKAEGLGYHSRKFKMQDVSFELEDGYILTLLGRNGAGKTTLLNILAGIRLDYKGEITYFGQYSDKQKENSGDIKTA